MIDSANGGQRKDAAQTDISYRYNTPKKAEQARIDEIRDKLSELSGDTQPPSGVEDKNTVPAISQDRKSPYDVMGIDHEGIRYKPTYLGKGGENIVYALSDLPDKVLKVEVEPLMTQIEEAESKGRPITNELTTGQRETLQERLEHENASYNELRTYFGEDHVPHTSKFIRKVPVSERLLGEIYKGKRRTMLDVTLADNEMWTIVAIQEKVPQIGDDKSKSPDVRGGFAELRQRKDIEKYTDIESYKQAYDDATQSLVCNPESASFDLDKFLVIHPDLRPLVSQANENSQLKDSLKDFVLKGMEYTKQTGKGLDLAGEKNILFFENPENNSWNYKLVDALSPHSEEALKEAKGLMEKVIAKEPLVDGEPFALTSAVNYVRTMNGLAKYVGIKEHIDMPQGQTIIPTKLWDILYQGTSEKPSPQKHEEAAV